MTKGDSNYGEVVMKNAKKKKRRRGVNVLGCASKSTVEGLICEIIFSAVWHQHSSSVAALSLEQCLKQ